LAKSIHPIYLKLYREEAARVKNIEKNLFKRKLKNKKEIFKFSFQVAIISSFLIKITKKVNFKKM